MDTKRPGIIGYLGRFVLLHVVTYLVFGVAFMVISSYFQFFATHDLLKDFMRPADSIFVRLAVPIQVVRGLLLALALYSFRTVIVESRYGWAKLFGVMWVLTGIGAVITGPGSIEGFIYTKFGFGNPLIGMPEVTMQMLAFSWLFWKWEGKILERLRVKM